MKEYLSQVGPLTANDSIQIVKALACGLGLAHKSGVIHRDVKPANVFVCANGYKLVDFGLVSTMTDETQITATNGIVGSPAYMAPEQLLGNPPSPSMDIYALGELLYEMVSGEQPFHADDCSELFTLKLHGEVEPLEEKVKCKLPKGLSKLVTDLLDRRIDKRPASCEEVIQLLDDLSKGTGYQIAPSSRTQKPSSVKGNRYFPLWLWFLPFITAFISYLFVNAQPETNHINRSPRLSLTRITSTWC